MNYWALMLRDLPATAQRQIARSQRISLPRVCPAETRLLLLRQALCHAATVRATYATLDPATQAAIQDLRHCRGGIAPDELARRYGPIRPWSQIAADLIPQSISERLALLGWLLLRPASHRHPARFLVPPELRGWLPVPLQLPVCGPAPTPEALPLATQIARCLLLACARQPLALRQDASLSRPALDTLHAIMPTEDLAVLIDCAQFVWPLLLSLGLVTPYGAEGQLTPAAERFLNQPGANQLLQLRTAWLAMPQPDLWLKRLLIDQRGIDWPLLRRRLVAWSEKLPHGQLLEPAPLYPALAATLGPLADSHTHGFRLVDRTPWQERRAASVFEAGVRGPLAWLGYIAWTEPATSSQAQYDSSQGYLFRLNLEQQTIPSTPCSPGTWELGLPGEVCISEGACDGDMLRLAWYTEQIRVNQSTIYCTITHASVAKATQAGLDAAILAGLIERHCGPLPDGWQSWLGARPTLTYEPGLVLRAEHPAALSRVLRERTIRRMRVRRIAPGVVLVHPDQSRALLRACQRRGIVVEGTPATDPVNPAAALSPGEAAALLVASAFYRAHAPHEAPFVPLELTERRLEARLTPRLRAALEPVLAELNPAYTPVQRPQPWLPPGGAPQAERIVGSDACLPVLRQAIKRRSVVRIGYAAEHGTLSERTIQPFTLEKRAGGWYLTAHCALRRAERTFRIDRIRWLELLPADARQAGLSSGIVQVIGRVGTDPPDPNDLDTLNCKRIKPVAAHTIGVWIDQGDQFGLQRSEEPVVQEALKHTVLNVGAIALHELEHLGAPLILDNIITDDGEHVPSLRP